MIRKALLLCFGIVIFSCVDELDIAVTNNGEVANILIVEATLTDELKKHRITLSRMDTILDLEIDSTFNPFGTINSIDLDLIKYEENAQVKVMSSSGTEFDFTEVSAGIYESDMVFAAQLNESYILKVKTSNGKGYTSEKSEIRGTSGIEKIHAEKIISDEGTEGIGIFIDSDVIEGESQNLRFLYNETYKIIAPNWSPSKFRLTNYDPCALPVPTYNLEIINQEEETQVCYRTVKSNLILQTQLSNLTNGGVKKFMVRFLKKDNFIISHRYSIEVAQLVSSSESFGFYEKLNNFSKSGNVFSQVQPGFLNGNLTSDDGSLDNVIGLFDVVSSTKERLFFNYSDFYPNDELPPFPFNCTINSSPESHRSYCATGPDGGTSCPLSIIEQIDLGLITYAGRNDSNIGDCPGPYTYVAKICGDCRTLGSNIVPEFWEE